MGDPDNVVYRSSWEKKCFIHFDHASYIEKWVSEDYPIPYISPKDGRWHRYFPDFVIITRNKEGEKQVTIIEVKPEKEKYPPKRQGKKKSRYLKEAMTYEVNIKKWEAAREYCEKRGWKFIILTEKQIF